MFFNFFFFQLLVRHLFRCLRSPLVFLQQMKLIIFFGCRYFSQSTVRSAKLAEMQNRSSVTTSTEASKIYRNQMAIFGESAIHALRCFFDTVLEVLKKDGSDGDAMALRLSTHMSSAEFKALLWFLSDVLSILGALSVTFQIKDLNLLSIERNMIVICQH